MADDPHRIVISGGGVIGTAIAYYLCQEGLAPTIVEREQMTCAASGKAGGFQASPRALRAIGSDSTGLVGHSLDPT